MVFSYLLYLADLFFRDCPASVEGKAAFTSSSVIATAVLKTVETLGVSYVKLSEEYKKKLESEFKNLNFPYRSETVSIFSDPCVFFNDLRSFPAGINTSYLENSLWHSL